MSSTATFVCYDAGPAWVRVVPGYELCLGAYGVWVRTPGYELCLGAYSVWVRTSYASVAYKTMSAALQRRRQQQRVRSVSERPNGG